jgi:hypothetical protein
MAVLYRNAHCGVRPRGGAFGYFHWVGSKRSKYRRYNAVILKEGAMAILKRNVTTAPAEKWNLVYDQGRGELYVEIHVKGSVKRHGVSAAMKMKHSDDLRLAIVDIFKGA